MGNGRAELGKYRAAVHEWLCGLEEVKQVEWMELRYFVTLDLLGKFHGWTAEEAEYLADWQIALHIFEGRYKEGWL